jgi:predicted RNA-binding protein with PUA-like domain
MAGKNRWLFKQEPESYGWHHLVADGSTWWDGVENALACKHLSSIRPNDLIFLYHTGKEKAVVGEMRAISGPSLPPQAPADARPTVQVSPVRPLPRPVSLAEIKGDPALATWDLVRLPRLSVMPVTPEQWKRVWELANTHA